MSKSTKIRAIPKIAENLALTKNEAAVLLPIIRGGNLTVGAIAVAVNKTISKVKRPLKSLKKKGLVEEVDGILPLYRAAPPVLPMADILDSFVDDSEKVQAETHTQIQGLQKTTEKTLGKITKGNDTRIADLNKAFETYEAEVVETVQAQITSMTSLTTKVLSDYSQKIQTALEDLNISVEDDVGEKLTMLQSELDQSQKQLSLDTKKISQEFDKWLKKEKTASLRSIKDVVKKATSLSTAIKKILQDALSNSQKALEGSIESVTSLQTSSTLETSNDISEILTNLGDALKQKSMAFGTHVTQNLQTSRKTLSDTTEEALSTTDTQAENLEKRFEDAMNLTRTFNDSIEGWKEEVNNHLDTATQSVIAQLDQLNASEKAFLEVVRSSLTGYIEKANASASDEYKTMRTLARDLTSDADALTSQARTSILELLQAEVTGNKDRLQQTNENLQDMISTWSEKATKAIDKKVKSAIKDVSSVLDTEVQELNSLTENLASRLKSSFSGVISTTETKNDAILSSIRRVADEYEAGLERELSDVVSQHISSVQQQVSEAKALYESLSNRLNGRLSDSISTLNSQLNRALKEIDTSIDEQVSRIDSHAEEMREEFHLRIDEMTSQFIAVTQSIESTFNGLIASQSVEAKDLIASAHTEFKSSMKSEMDDLDDDSIKLQQEFASEIGMRIDSVLDSTASLKRTLDEFSSEKSSEISKRMGEAVDAIELSLSETQQSLLEIETGTVKQFTENVQQLSKELETSVAGARDNISERLKSITTETSDILAKNGVNVKNTVDNYLSEELESMQRILGETSKKLDKLAATNIKKTTEKVEEFYASLETAQDAAATRRTKSRDETMASIDERRSETIVAFDSASTWLDSAITNISNSLEALGSKMSNEVLHIQQGLGKSSETTVKAMRDRAQTQTSQLEEVSQSFFDHVETLLQSSVTELDAASESTINIAIDKLADIPDKLASESKQMTKNILTDHKTHLDTTQDSLKSQILDLENTSKGTGDELNNLVAQVIEQMTRTKDTTVEQIEHTAITSNQHATRKFESIGLELNAALSSKSLEVVEGISSQVTESISEIQDIAKAGTSKVSTATSTLQSNRSDMLKTVASETNDSLNTWAENAHKYSSDLSANLLDATLKTTESARKTASMLTAVHGASSETKQIPSQLTWYLSGEEEICAQIIDMAKRAERSVLVSVPQLDCLDMKKLAKIKVPSRKVLIIPRSEDKDPALDLLKGWRIWELNAPQLLSVADEKEILIGGQSLADSAMCILSRDESYLQLYQDVLGPRLVADAEK